MIRISHPGADKLNAEEKRELPDSVYGLPDLR